MTEDRTAGAETAVGTAAEAAASLADAVPLVVDGGPAGTVASTVVDATGATWRVLREGAITTEQLHAVR